jgi:ribosomal-protein-serine acetyltransferase
MDRQKHRTLVPMFEELRGVRVLVRPYRPEDAQALREAVEESREHIRPWLPFADAHQTVEESRDWIIQSNAKWLLRESMNSSVWDLDTGRFLGGLGLHAHVWEIRYFEIGYWLRKSAEGHGYMAEAVKLLVDYAFNELKANRLEIRCDERNERSASIPKRLGFAQEARLRNESTSPEGELRNTLIFGLIPDDR